MVLASSTTGVLLQDAFWRLPEKSIIVDNRGAKMLSILVEFDSDLAAGLHADSRALVYWTSYQQVDWPGMVSRITKSKSTANCDQPSA